MSVVTSGYMQTHEINCASLSVLLTSPPQHPACNCWYGTGKYIDTPRTDARLRQRLMDMIHPQVEAPRKLPGMWEAVRLEMEGA